MSEIDQLCYQQYYYSNRLLQFIFQASFNIRAATVTRICKGLHSLTVCIVDDTTRKLYFIRPSCERLR